MRWLWMMCSMALKQIEVKNRTVIGGLALISLLGVTKAPLQSVGTVP